MKKLVLILFLLACAPRIPEAPPAPIDTYFSKLPEVEYTELSIVTASHTERGVFTADGSEEKQFIMVTPQTVFSAVCAHATTASAVLDKTNFFKSYMLTNSATVCPSTNVWVIDMATASTTAGAYIIGPKDATGTAYGQYC